MAEIEDGTGTNNRAKVTSEFRLAVDSISTAHISHESIENGEAYVIASDFISLTTTGSYNSLLHLKCDITEKHFHIERIRVCSTASNYAQLKVIANATGGTIISDANKAHTNNLNMSSGNVTDGRLIAYAASGDGKTNTGGEHFTQFTNKAPGHSDVFYYGALMIYKGNSITIECKPNTAGDFCIEVIGYFDNKH